MRSARQGGGARFVSADPSLSQSRLGTRTNSLGLYHNFGPHKRRLASRSALLPMATFDHHHGPFRLHAGFARPDDSSVDLSGDRGRSQPRSRKHTRRLRVLSWRSAHASRRRAALVRHQEDSNGGPTCFPGWHLKLSYRCWPQTYCRHGTPQL
jgi:hypothetical protein